MTTPAGGAAAGRWTDSGALRALARVGLRLAYPPLRLLWFLARSDIHGVQCVIRRGDEVLLVRHTYGDRRRWELPGGAIKRGERPREAATREIREELGLEISNWREVGEVRIRLDWRTGSLACFATSVNGLDPHPRVDDVEIEELRWFERDALPANRGPHVATIVALASRESRESPESRESREAGHRSRETGSP